MFTSLPLMMGLVDKIQDNLPGYIASANTALASLFADGSDFFGVENIRTFKFEEYREGIEEAAAKDSPVMYMWEESKDQDRNHYHNRIYAVTIRMDLIIAGDTTIDIKRGIWDEANEEYRQKLVAEELGTNIRWQLNTLTDLLVEKVLNNPDETDKRIYWNSKQVGLPGNFEGVEYPESVTIERAHTVRATIRMTCPVIGGRGG